MTQADANRQLTAGPSHLHLLAPSAGELLLERPAIAAINLASGICANITRWALERNCMMLSPGHPSGLTFANETIDSIQLKHQGSAPHSSAAQPNHLSLLLPINAQQHQLEEVSPLTKLVANHLFEPMHQLEAKVNYYFSDIWLSSGDERTNKLPLMGAGPWKLIYATLIYLYLIKSLLPRLMRPFKPLELNWIIRLYNLFMVVSNLWAFFHGARILNFGLKCFGCETINHRDYSPQAIELLLYGWLFFLSRLVEWLDTIFFVLRKKERQVTKLHVFHHSFVPLISWTYLKYHPGYTVAFFPLVNSLVHSIMYTYYLLATFGPSIQPYLWWKRYLTSLQIAQFVFIIIQLASIPLTGDDTCQYPRGFLYVAFAGAILFLWLFFTYYLETYTRNKRNIINQVAKRSINDQIARPKQREGTSRALSDTIDNAIVSEDEQPVCSLLQLDSSSTKQKSS